MVLPGRKGLVSGIVVSGVGIGAFMYGIIANKLVNPENYKALPVEINAGVYESYFPSLVNDRVPDMFRSLSLIWTVALFASFLLV